jgi:tetratricopeptide (TPR) repeat protein/spermidine synthase
MFWTIMAVIWLAHLYPLFTMGTPGFDNFFNPTNFEIVSEERTPAGRMTLLISRDYDDRFHAVFWNQQQALTQSSRAVQSDLYRMGHIPMLLAAENARVLTLGLGSSLPIEAVTMHHPASVECVEPEAAMLRLSKATERTSRPRPWLKDVIYHNERIESFLLRATSQYDVILSAEPLAQSAPSPAVLTEEYFASIASLLTQQGIFAQWLSVARMDLDAMRPVIAALLAVFPHAEMWISSPDPEIAMIGIVAAKQPFTKDQPSAARFERLFTSSSELRLHFLRMEMGSFPSLLSAYGTNRTGLERLASGSSTEGLFQQIQLRTNQDPQNIFLDVNTLLSSRTPPDRMLAGQADSIRSLTSALLEERPLVMRAKASVLAGDDTSAFRMLDEILVRTPRNEEAARVLSDLFLRQAAGYVGAEKYGPAVSLISRALQLAPVNTYLLRLLMISSFYIGDREAAGLSIDGIKRMDPSHAGFRDNQATIRARQGATDDALLLYENAITLDARNEEFYCNMASFHYSQNRTWEAIRVLDQAADRAYYPAKAWYLKGMFYAEQGKIKFAREAYEAYLKAASPLDPYLTDVLQRLVELKKFKER